MLLSLVFVLLLFITIVLYLSIISFSEIVIPFSLVHFSDYSSSSTSCSLNW